MALDYPCPPLTLYHNPDCSKSREAHKLLTDKLGADEFRVVPYLDQPLTRPLLETLVIKLGAAVKDIVRDKDAAKIGIDVAKASDDQLYAALVNHPAIMQRPIAEAAIAAVIGRPPERVLDLIVAQP